MLRTNIRAIRSFFQRKAVNTTLKVLLVTLVIVFALVIRINTFWLPHLGGDQGLYLGLAMKLDNFGFEQYSLKGIHEYLIYLDKAKKMQLAIVEPTKDPLAKGDILEIFERVAGVTYYTQPFFHKPPGYAFSLLIGHKLLAKKDQPYVVVASNLGEYVKKLKPFAFFDSQFYAVAVLLFYNIGIIILTFFLGKTLFSYRVGIYAALMMGINPISIVLGHKLFSDDMVAFFVQLSLIIFVLAIRKRSSWLTLLAGISCGLAVLGKQTGGFLLIALWLFTIVTHEKKIYEIGSLPRIVFNRYFVLLTTGVFLVSGFWFVKIYQIYGHPLWLPHQANDPSGWLKVLSARPSGWVLYLVGIPAQCPVLLPAYLSIKNFVFEVSKAIVKKKYDYRFILLWAVILTFGYQLRGGHEHRRMMPVYPAIAILAGYYLNRFRCYSGKFSRFLGNKVLREAGIMVFIAVCAFWTIPMAMDIVFTNRQLIRIPF